MNKTLYLSTGDFFTSQDNDIYLYINPLTNDSSALSFREPKLIYKNKESDVILLDYSNYKNRMIIVYKSIKDDLSYIKIVKFSYNYYKIYEMNHNIYDLYSLSIPFSYSDLQSLTDVDLYYIPKRGWFVTIMKSMQLTNEEGLIDYRLERITKILNIGNKKDKEGSESINIIYHSPGTIVKPSDFGLRVKGVNGWVMYPWSEVL